MSSGFQAVIVVQKSSVDNEIYEFFHEKRPFLRDCLLLIMMHEKILNFQVENFKLLR